MKTKKPKPPNQNCVAAFNGRPEILFVRTPHRFVMFGSGASETRQFSGGRFEMIDGALVVKVDGEMVAAFGAGHFISATYTP